MLHGLGPGGAELRACLAEQRRQHGEVRLVSIRRLSIVTANEPRQGLLILIKRRQRATPPARRALLPPHPGAPRLSVSREYILA